MFALGGGSIWKMWKFMILINACCGPAMLMGFLWRRTNAKAVWAAMGVSLALTLFIPFCATFVPGIKDNPAFHMEVSSAPIVKVYTASKRDVEERRSHIDQWETLNKLGKANGTRPEPLTTGQKFEKTYAPAAKAIFWDEGLKKEKDGTVNGVGFFKADLYILHRLGMDLGKYSPAIIECFSLAFKLLFPFIAVFAVGLLTKPQDKKTLDLFYAKLRTPVGETHEADEQAMIETADNPARFDDVKLLPGSNWEFDRQTAGDWKGIILGVLAGVTIVGLIILLANLGA
jgi:SSS family solute:Na+ symporter